MKCMYVLLTSVLITSNMGIIASDGDKKTAAQTTEESERALQRNATWFDITLGTLDPEKIPAAFAKLPNEDVNAWEKEKLRKYLPIAFPGIKLPESTSKAPEPSKPDAGDSKNNGATS